MMEELPRYQVRDDGSLEQIRCSNCARLEAALKDIAAGWCDLNEAFEIAARALRPESAPETTA